MSVLIIPDVRDVKDKDTLDKYVKDLVMSQDNTGG